MKSAFAATYNVSTTFDIENINTSPFCCGYEWTHAFGSFSPITAQNGDTINLSFSFTENEALQLSGSTGQGFIFYLYPHVGSVSTQTAGTITLTNYLGDVDQTSATQGVTNSFTQFISHIYANFTDTTFSLLSASVSLTLLSGAPTPITFNQVLFRPYASDVNVGPVPLPAALPLFGAGLGLLGAASWWKRRRGARVAKELGTAVSIG
jgi:hypothetical protein